MPKEKSNMIHILHVDDDKSFIEVSKLVIKDIDDKIEVEAAYSAEEAVNKLETKPYDLIISDYEMPDKTGIDLLKQIRSKNNQIPFILFTGKGRETVAIQALNYGADRYLDKHGNPETVYNELVINIHQLCEKAQVKKLLWESEERFKKMMESVTDIVMLTNTDGAILYISPSCKDFLGYEQNELVGKHFSFTHPADCEDVKIIFTKAFTQISSGLLEYRVLTKSGETKWVHHSYSQIIENGKIKQVVSTLTDITHRVLFELSIAENEAKYKAAEERYRATFESTGTAVIVIKEDSIISLVNAEWEKLTGYSKEETEGKKKWTEFVADENLGWMKEQYKLRQTNGEAGTRQYEFKLKTKSGEIKNIYLTISSLPGSKEVLASLADITEAQKMREQLQKSEYLYRMIAQNIEDVVVLADINAVFLYVSPAVRKVFGFEPDELIGKKIFDYLHPDDLEKSIMPYYQKSLLGQTFPPVEIRSKNKSGDYLWVESTFKAIKEANGEIRIIIVSRNIDERKKAEQALRESEERYSKLSKAAFEGILISREGKALDANTQFLEFHQYQLSELLGKDVGMIVAPESRELVRKNMLSGFEGPYEFIGLRKDGTTFPIEVKAKSITYKGYPARVSAVQDITERKKNQEQLLIFSSLFELANEAIYVCDLDGRILYFNEEACKQIGYSREEMAKTSIHEFSSPEAAKLVQTRIDSIVKNKTAVFETEHMRKDKSVFPVEVSSRVIESNGKRLLLNVTRDISERKKAEKNLAIVNEKLRVVGQLTRHDVRNKLSVINGTSYVIKRKYLDDPELVSDLERIESAVNMSNRLLEFTKLYESMGVEEQVVVDVKRCFDEAVSLFHKLNNLEIVNKADGLTATADSLLRQVFYDLIDNSLKHGKKVTKISLRYRRAADKIKLIYEDNGVGIPIEDKPKIVHEGFTTGNGTGLGLWLVKKVLDVYHWSIQENGVPTKGARFEITIPASKAQLRRKT